MYETEMFSVADLRGDEMKTIMCYGDHSHGAITQPTAVVTYLNSGGPACCKTS
jgi:hypothetical protein